MHRSSTSSSERPPWAGVWAAIVVIAIDSLLFSSWGPWKLLEERVSSRELLSAGIVRGRLELRGLAAAPEGTARVVVVGSSRAQAGVLPGLGEAPEREPPALHVAKLTHAGMDIFAMRSLADELAGYRPDVVLLLLSEFDTHRPPEPRPAASFGSFRAVVDLAWALGPRFAFEARAHLYRLALASVLHAYRYRSIIDAAGARNLRSFPTGERRPENGEGVSPAVFPYPAGERSPLDARRNEQLSAEIERRFSKKSRLPAEWQAQRLRSLGRGGHVEVHMKLLRRAVGRLRAAGAGVILVEAPISPLGAEYYDPGIRDDFVAFAQDLARDPGVRFLPLKVNAIYPEEEFHDMTHLKAVGSRKLTAGTLQAVREMLEDRS